MYVVSVGIPAYNEERNMGALLSSILEQEMDGKGRVHEIIVVSDGCTDRTPQILHEFSKKDSRIKTYHYDRRRGKAIALNEIFERSTGDFLVLFDADVIPSDNYIVSNLVSPLVSDSDIGLVGGLPVPFPPTTLIERASVFSDKIQHYIKEHINKGQNIYAAHGRVLALSSNFMRKARIPSIPGTDAYLYLKCIASGFSFRYVGNQASVYYRAPRNMKDYLRQSIRFKKVQGIMRDIFGHMATKESDIPKVLLLRAYFKNFLKDPRGGFLWTILFLYATAKSGKAEVSSKWEISRSSKSISYSPSGHHGHNPSLLRERDSAKP